MERTRAVGADVDIENAEGSRFASFFCYVGAEAGRSASIVGRGGNNPRRSRGISGGGRKHSSGHSGGCDYNRRC